jgi:hypothetical protein
MRVVQLDARCDSLRGAGLSQTEELVALNIVTRASGRVDFGQLQ